MKDPLKVTCYYSVVAQKMINLNASSKQTLIAELLANRKSYHLLWKMYQQFRSRVYGSGFAVFCHQSEKILRLKEKEKTSADFQIYDTK